MKTITCFKISRWRTGTYKQSCTGGHLALLHL